MASFSAQTSSTQSGFRRVVVPGLLVLLCVLGYFLFPSSAQAGALWWLAAAVATIGTWTWLRVSEKRRERAAPHFGPSFATLALVAEKTTSSVVITDALGRIDWVNEAFTRLTGYELPEVQGRQPGRLLQGTETNPATITEFRAGLAGGKTFEIELLNYRKDGRPYWVQMKIDPVCDPAGRLQHWIAIQTDVTARRRMEIMSTGVLTHAAHGIIATDASGTIEIFNPGAEQLTGRRASEVIGRSGLSGLIDPTELVARSAEYAAKLRRVVMPGFDAIVCRTLETGRPDEQEWLLVRPDGQRVAVRLAVGAMRDASGQLTGFLAIASEITAERIAESRRREFDQRLRKIASQVPGLVYQLRLSADGRMSFPYASEGIREIFGVTPADVAEDAKAVLERVHPDDAERVAASIRDSARSLEPWTCEYRYLGTDGRERWLLGNAMPERDNEGTVLWHGLITDVTGPKKAEQAHAQSRAFLQSIYASADLAIFTLEVIPTGGFCYGEVNPGFERLSGLSAGRVCGRRPGELAPAISPEDAASLQVNVERCLAADDSVEFEEQVTFEGRRVWWLTRLTPLTRVHGKVVRLVGRAVDITERKLAELRAQSLSERLQLASAAAQIGIWDFDIRTRRQIWDERLQQIYGVAPASFDGSYAAWARRVHPADLGRVERLFEEALRGEKDYETTFRILRGTGEVRTLRAVGHVEREAGGEARRMVGVNWDITAEQDAQDEMLRAKNESEQLNRLLGDALGRAKELAREAAAAGVAKSAFLANMSHEIRTPLNAVLGMSSLLLSSGLDKEQRELAETIRSSGDSLLELLNDILDFSKIDSGKLELERQTFGVRDCIESAMDVLAGRAAEKKLDLLYWMADDVPPVAVGDVTRLRQVILNLIGNAVKFTAQGEIYLTVRSIAPALVGGLRLHVAVHDSGIGVPPDRLDRLFKSFSQVDASTTRNFGGTGLGLAISKRLVELMGGKIWVESAEGKGSVFQFEVELAPASKGGESMGHEAVTGFHGRRVLIVDDNPTQCRVLCLQAVTWGLIPRATTSALEALAWIERGDAFDLAVVDQHMPDLTGTELVARLRATRSPLQLPVIILTRLGQSLPVGAIGVMGCSPKPIKPRSLLGLVRQAFAGAVKSGQPTAVLDENIAGAHSLRVLLVEDNTVNQRVATLMLKKLGYTADVAGNGREAVAAVERRDYDIVFMDLQMPEMDGFEAARTICARWPAGKRPRIVAMTANVSASDQADCAEAGMDGFTSKPVQMQHMREVLLATPARIAV
jgi:PAS domain S-box-containing protein